MIKVMTRFVLAICILGCLMTSALAQPITYQGQVQRNSQVFSDTVAMEFRLYDALTGGTQIGPVIPKPTQPVTDGVFQVELDFGSAAFIGAPRYLEVTIEGTTLSPRQAVTATPVAVYALSGNAGPQGDPGPAGAQGPQGPAGPAGPDLPAGTLMMYAGNTVPEGYLIANGAQVSRTTYADLFQAIGTTYGIGDGTTTFNLPDFQLRFPLGASGALGITGGATTKTLTVAELPSHTHSVTDPGHIHSYSMGRNDGNVSSNFGEYPPGDSFVADYSISTSTASTGITVNATGGGEAFSIMNPYLTVHYIIKY